MQAMIFDQQRSRLEVRIPAGNHGCDTKIIDGVAAADGTGNQGNFGERTWPALS